MGALEKFWISLVWIALCICGCGGFVLPANAQGAPSQAGSASVSTPSGNAASTGSELPDSPGATTIAATESAGRIFQAAQNQPAQPAGQAQQAAPQKPVGTAAAEAPNASGIAASQPAGVAIAPAKQRRARTIVLRVGAIIAAGAAVGTVVALTAATPSKPPGAH